MYFPNCTRLAHLLSFARLFLLELWYLVDNWSWSKSVWSSQHQTWRNLDLLLGESLAKVPHHAGKLLPIDETVPILVMENFDQIFNWPILPRQTLGMPRGSHPLHSLTLASGTSCSGTRGSQSFQCHPCPPTPGINSKISDQKKLKHKIKFDRFLKDPMISYIIMSTSINVALCLHWRESNDNKRRKLFLH